MDSNLPRTMKALVTHGPGDYRLEERSRPVAGPGEVVIRVKAAGICAGDVKCFGGSEMFWGDGVSPGYCQPPVVPGHEFVGEVVELGEGAADKHGLRIGDMATSEQIVPCWECRFCKSGKYWQCRRHDIYGFRQIAQGAMAEYMLFPAGAVNHKVPCDLPIESGVLIEPMGCAIHAVQRASVQLGDVVVVSGCGTLGLCMVGAAKLFSPAMLIALDIREHKLDLACRIGADLALNPASEDVAQRVLELTDGYGCDVYIEAVGNSESVKQGMKMIRRLGTFVEFGVFTQDTSLDWTVIGDGKELNVLGAHLSPYTYPTAIDYMHCGRIDMTGIVTHLLPLAEFEKGFGLVHQGSQSIKVALVP